MDNNFLSIREQPYKIGDAVIVYNRSLNSISRLQIVGIEYSISEDHFFYKLNGNSNPVCETSIFSTINDYREHRLKSIEESRQQSLEELENSISDFT